MPFNDVKYPQISGAGPSYPGLDGKPVNVAPGGGQGGGWLPGPGQGSGGGTGYLQPPPSNGQGTGYLPPPTDAGPMKSSIDYSQYGNDPNSVYGAHPGGLPTDWSWDDYRTSHPTQYDPSGMGENERYRSWIEAGRPGWDASGRRLDVRGQRIAVFGEPGFADFGPTDPNGPFGPHPENTPKPNEAPWHGIAPYQDPSGGKVPRGAWPEGGNPATRGPAGIGRPGFGPGFPTTTPGGGNPAFRGPTTYPGGGYTPTDPTGVVDLTNLASRKMGNNPMTGSSKFGLGSFARSAPRGYQGYQ